MLAPRRFYRQPTFWRFLTAAALILANVLVFRNELGYLWDLLWGNEITLPAEVQRDYQVILVLLLLSFIFFFLVYSFVVSQFVLPVSTLQERLQVVLRFALYLLGLHGPAITIREGKVVANPVEMQSILPGVAFVDLASAVGLERQWFPRDAFVALSRESRRPVIFPRLTLWFYLIGRRLYLRLFRRNWVQPPVTARAVGPGLVFTHFGERVKGTVNLRRQFRGQMVAGTMRDGFEVSSYVFVIFTVGEPPEVLLVASIAAGADNLRVVRLNDQNQIIELSDELDPDDRLEFDRWLQDPRWDDLDRIQIPSPYVFDERRAFRAVYGAARRADNDEIENWTDLPLKVATRLYHDMVGEQNYDVLYPREDNDPFEFFRVFRPRFSQRLRNQGVLALQYVRRRDGQPLAVGQTWNPDQLDIFRPHTLRTNKVLRDRGIRVIFAGAAELRPDERVLKQRFLRWKASHESRFDMDMAASDYNVLLIRARARAQAQEEIITLLNQILALNASRQEIAQRLFQVLETMAQEAETRKFLPSQTQAELSNIHRWLFEEK